VNYFFLVKEKEDYSKFQTKTIFDPLDEKANSILKTLDVKLNGLNKIMYEKEDPLWNELLDNAESVDLCLFYVNKEWMDQNENAFHNFINNGNTLNVYLPNPSEIMSRYHNNAEINPAIRENIISSFWFFKNLRVNKSSKISIKQLNQGLNYVFAKIIYKDKKVSYYLSPYSNTRNEGYIPKFLFDHGLPDELSTFFDKELDLFKKESKDFIDLEQEQYYFFKKDRETLYLSTGLVCHYKCKFCYTNSLITNKKNTYKPLYVAQLLCKIIELDNRIKKEENGTVFMLGGYNDPFFEDHFDATIHILETLSKYNNPIHIATRHELTSEQIERLPVKKNIVINYSISSFPSGPVEDIEIIELNNQKSRFDTMNALIKKGHNVALFIRPIIKDVTIHHLPTILQHAGTSGIEVITVGGLYFDDRIEESLYEHKIVIDKNDVENKVFVLSANGKCGLKKTCIKETKTIMKNIKEYAKKENTSFNVFESAKERVIHFKTFHRQGKTKTRR